MLHHVLLFIVFNFFAEIHCKYVEGELNTHENWAFLSRFCFLSEYGQFEYHIEFNEDFGDVNLLLYYDTEDQWPSVYKTDKSCWEKEQILNIGQNQIVNLSTTMRDFSGCSFQAGVWTTPRPRYTLSVPTIPPKITKRTTTVMPSTTEEDYFNNGTSTTPFEVLESTTIETTKKPVKRSIPPIKNKKMGRIVVCHNARRFRSSRERWWYIAVSNCNSSKGIHIKYRLLMTNGQPGDYWHEQFSADEFYILPVLMAFSIAYSFLLLGIIMCSLELKQRQLLHTTYKIFVLSVMLQLFGILFESVVYLKYAVSGLASPKVKRFGAMLMGASETTFLLLLLLLAKGFTITRGRLPIGASVKLTIFMCLYTITYISIFIYEAQVFDPGEVLYLYESPAGYSLIILRIFAWFMFIYSTVFTLKHYPEKGNFYYPFNIFGTLWFVAGPAFILSANTYIDKWVRESIVCAVLLFITFGGHLMFLLLTMPSVANKNFPYHVRTTQIGIMELTGGTTGAGTSTIENFGHHVYEPSFGAVRDQTVIIPLTRRTEEIFEGMYHQTSFRRPHAPQLEPLALETEMQNVLTWSMAKNVSPGNIPAIEYHSPAKSNGHRPESGSTLPEEQTGYLNDYVKDVPIELFTVSKMVVNRRPSAEPEPQ